MSATGLLSISRIGNSMQYLIKLNLNIKKFLAEFREDQY